jgi:hypothetical protein
MQHRDHVAEDPTEPIDRLRRERDLRNEHDRGLAPLAHDALKELDVHQRLAASGDTVQEKDVARRARRERIDRALLVGCGRVWPRGRESARRERIAAHNLFIEHDETARNEPLQHRRREAELLDEMLDRRAPAERLQELEQHALLRGAREDPIAAHQRRKLVRDDGDTAELLHRRRRRGTRHEHRQRASERDAERHDVIRGDPATELEHRRVDRRLGIRNIDDRLVAPGGIGGLGESDTHAYLAAIAKRHQHAGPWNERVRELAIDAIRERTEQRQRQRDLDERPVRGRGLGPTHGRGRRVSRRRSANTTIRGE